MGILLYPSFCSSSWKLQSIHRLHMLPKPWKRQHETLLRYSPPKQRRQLQRHLRRGVRWQRRSAPAAAAPHRLPPRRPRSQMRLRLLRWRCNCSLRPPASCATAALLPCRPAGVRRCSSLPAAMSSSGRSAPMTLCTSQLTWSPARRMACGWSRAVARWGQPPPSLAPVVVALRMRRAPAQLSPPPLLLQVWTRRHRWRRLKAPRLPPCSTAPAAPPTTAFP